MLRAVGRFRAPAARGRARALHARAAAAAGDDDDDGLEFIEGDLLCDLATGNVHRRVALAATALDITDKTQHAGTSRRACARSRRCARSRARAAGRVPWRESAENEMSWSRQLGSGTRSAARRCGCTAARHDRRRGEPERGASPAEGVRNKAPLCGREAERGTGNPPTQASDPRGTRARGCTTCTPTTPWSASSSERAAVHRAQLVRLDTLRLRRGSPGGTSRCPHARSISRNVASTRSTRTTRTTSFFPFEPEILNVTQSQRLRQRRPSRRSRAPRPSSRLAASARRTWAEGRAARGRRPSSSAVGRAPAGFAAASTAAAPRSIGAGRLGGGHAATRIVAARRPARGRGASGFRDVDDVGRGAVSLISLSRTSFAESPSSNVTCEPFAD